jgi:hypothetical protein
LSLANKLRAVKRGQPLFGRSGSPR